MFAPRVIVFDLDGTLLDTRPTLVASCNHTLQHFGKQPLPMEEVIRYVGDGSRRLMARAARVRDDDPRLDSIVEEFANYYLAHPVQGTTWMPFATHVLETLADIPLALCTNKPRAITDRVLDALQATERFSMIVGGDDMPRPKPAPDALLHICKQLDVNPKELVIVGDGPQDILCGKSVEARTVALAKGYTSESILRELRPDVLLDDLRTLPDVVERWREATVRIRWSQP